MKKTTENKFIYEEPMLSVVEIEADDVVTSSSTTEEIDPDQGPWLPVD